MAIFYDNQKLIPAPQVVINKEFQRNDAGEIRRVVYTVTVRGFLVASKGSPNYQGDWHTGSGYPSDTPAITYEDIDGRIAIFREKISSLTRLFETDGKFFEIQPYDGSASIKFIPRVRSINFDEGPDNWVNRVPYFIDMETDEIFYGENGNGDNEDLNDVDESWAVEPAEDTLRSYKVTHTLSAQGRDEYDPAGTGTLLRPAWEVARDDLVEPRLGFDVTIANSSNVVNDLNGWEPYNYVRVENIDITGGKYSITETWTLVNSMTGYLEDYTVSVRQNNTDGLTSVTVDGTITGYDTRDETTGELITSRYENANAALAAISGDIFDRATDYSGFATLNPDALSTSATRNPLSGIITYSREYNDRPNTATTYGGLSMVINVTDKFPSQVIARHICVERTEGPVLQDIGTQTEYQRSLTIEVNTAAERYLTSSTTTVASKPNVEALVATYIPTGANIQGPYVQDSSDQWSPTTGKYVRSVVWIWSP